MKNIEEIVLTTVKEIGEEEDNKELKEADSRTILFGKNLDSMGIVLLVTEIEEEIFEEYGKEIALADERAMSQKTSPFRSVKSLVKYIGNILDQEDS